MVGITLNPESAFAQPFATSSAVPLASIHMDGVFPSASVSELPCVANESTQQ